MPKQKQIEPEEVVTASQTWETSAIIQLQYKLKDVLEERKTKLQATKATTDEELTQIETALKQLK